MTVIFHLSINFSVTLIHSEFQIIFNYRINVSLKFKLKI